MSTRLPPHKRIRSAKNALHALLSQGKARVRNTEWKAKDAYLKFELVKRDGKWMRTSWALLFSRTEQEAVKAPTPQRLPIHGLDASTNWVEYTGALDKADVPTTPSMDPTPEVKP